MSRNNRAGLCLFIFAALLASARPASTQSNLFFFGIDEYGVGEIPDGTYAAVSASYDFAVGIRTDGTLAAWGSDPGGTGVLNCPSGTFSAVATGEWGGWAVGLKTDGTLVSWGDDRYGQLSVPGGTFTAVTTMEGDGLGLRSDGSVVEWGSYGGVTSPTGTFTAISGPVGLKADGSVQEYYGPTAPAGTFTSVSSGLDGELGIRSDGTVTCWGGSDQEDPPSGTFIAVASGYGLDAGIRSDGTLAVWNIGQTPPVIPGTYSSVSASYEYLLAIQAVPEPSSLLALLFGVAGLGGIALHRRG